MELWNIPVCEVVVGKGVCFRRGRCVSLLPYLREILLCGMSIPKVSVSHVRSTSASGSKTPFTIKEKTKKKEEYGKAFLVSALLSFGL